MRVPLSWLRQFVDLDLEPEVLAERLTLLGMEVKGIERIGADWQRVVVGELLEVRPHPGTARLSLALVGLGDGGGPLSIVCGATNIAAGQRVPVALPGAVLPGERRIEVARIAGEESQGMLCSGHELGLSDDAEGILILPSGTPLGRPLVEIAGDVVLDVDVKPNRGDALSILGLAREVAAATGARLRRPDVRVPESGDATADHLSVEVLDPALCPRFVGRWVDGVRVGPSPLDVQRRLVAAGVRPVSNVVDASNYVMLELGKPIHTFDADAVHEGRIIVRRARAGERLETLDHVVRTLDEETLLIADPAGALAIAGVMGGAASEVSEGTSRVIIESAIFDPVSIRRSAFRYALRSEASLRFEKGQEHALARLGADRTAELVARWAGGRVARGVVDSDPLEPPTVRIPFRPARVRRLLGDAIPAEEMRALLARVEIATAPARVGDEVPLIAEDPGGTGGGRVIALGPDEVVEALVAIVPSHRRDLRIEADVAEEIARVRGYETLAGRLPDTPMPAYRPDPRRGLDALLDLLSGRGLVEVLTHGLVSPEDHARLGLGVDDPDTIRAANPVTVDHSQLRRSFLPGHLRVLVENERQRHPDVHLFEVGSLHRWVDGGPAEHRVLGILLAGERRPPAFDGPGGAVDVADLKGLLEWLVARHGATARFEAVAPRPGVDHPGRCALIVAETSESGRRVLGRLGEVHPRLLAAYDVRAEHVIVAEMACDALLDVVPRRLRVGPLDRLPGIERDIAVVVGRDRPVGEVASVIGAAGGPHLHEARLFDRYAGPPLAEGEMSLAFRLRFEPGERSMDESAVESAVTDVVTALRERLGARLRA
jgi:phenylalanyl-tRNA synthetase beta chain